MVWQETIYGRKPACKLDGTSKTSGEPREAALRQTGYSRLGQRKGMGSQRFFHVEFRDGAMP